MLWAPETVLAAFLVFCRIGGCLIVMPGFSSTRIPMRIRLFLALAVSLALTPVLFDAVRPYAGTAAPATMFAAILAESLTGFLIGFLARLFFLALETIGAVVTQALGLAAIPGMGIEDGEAHATMTTLFTLTAVTLMFVTDQHWLILRGLLASYETLPPGQGFDIQRDLIAIADQLTAVFLVVLRIGAPFIIYSMLVNFAVGITNKLTPQIPVFFVAMPFVTAGGMFLLYYTVVEFMRAFTAAFASWAASG
jgi:flagellar biosynthetic protein FliR